MAENPPTLKKELQAQRFSVHIRAPALKGTYTAHTKEYGP
jgi:hypothetical protein